MYCNYIFEHRSIESKISSYLESLFRLFVKPFKGDDFISFAREFHTFGP